jgi:hypothetical protein
MIAAPIVVVASPLMRVSNPLRAGDLDRRMLWLIDEERALDASS